MMTFLWHDYETFGTHPMLDRPAQFAAIRTDARLDAVGEPLNWLCRPARDMLPHPEACLITGLTPQKTDRDGLVEAEFAARIHAAMMEPNTCSAGYNSLRFDDEFTRNLFYRNLREPYEREYRNGNSRWDLINLARMCYALRPAGVTWPEHESGLPSFRLEDLAAANGIQHGTAHDALADVRATIALAQCLRSAQPRLFDWALSLRDQAAAMDLLKPLDPQPLVHTSGRYPARRGCTTLVLPLALVPERPKSVIVFDLMTDPGDLLALDPGAITDRVFTSSVDLPDGVERIPLKAVHSNKVPMLAPASVLTGVDCDRIDLDPTRCARHAEAIKRDLDAVRAKVMEVFTPPVGEPGEDPDVMLYSGGFFSPRDRATLNRILATAPADLGRTTWRFEDPRLDTMLFRYRARNWPDTLDAAAWSRWEADRKRRLIEPRLAGQLGLAEFRLELQAAREANSGNTDRMRILDAVEAWMLDLGLET